MESKHNCAVWFRVSSEDQYSANQVPDVKQFTAHHGYRVACRYTVSDSAWKNGGGEEYRATLQAAMDDAWAGKFSVLIVWALDRIVREGPEDALRIFREFSERGCVILSVRESWLNGSPEVQGLMIAIAGWMAQQESRRRSERTRAGMARAKAEGKRIGGRKPGARDLRPRQTAGYRRRYAREG